MVALRDGKTYDPSSGSLGGEPVTGTGSRRRSTAATAPPSAQRPGTRRSARLASSTGPEADEQGVPFQSSEEPATPVRGKRQRPQQQLLTAVPGSPGAAADAADDQDVSDIGNIDQDMQLRHAAAMDLPPDSPSSGGPSVAKKPRIPSAARTPTPSKTAAAAAKLCWETMSVSLAAAVMVLVAAVATAALLPGLASHREQLRVRVLETAAHTNTAYLQPWKAHAAVSFSNAKIQLAAASAAAQQQAQAALLQAQERWEELVTRLRSAGPGAAPAAAPGGWAVDTLASILPDGPQWAEYAADISDKLRAPAAQRSHKAPALLLACGSEDDCNEAAAALAVLPPKGEACTLTVDSSDLAPSEGDSAAHPAAALQALLAPFLHRCPAGLVVLRGAEALPVAAIPALHNALSELGGFQHDGKVDGSRAAYALLLQMHPAGLAALSSAADSASTEAAIKEAFFSTLSAQLQAAAAAAHAEESAHWGAVERAVNTLHRRIEFAAPVRLGTSTEAALDAATSQEGKAGAAAAAA